MKDAECRKDWVDPAWFFPGRGKSNDIAMAKFACFVCPVQNECKSYRAETQSEYGIWAGENAQDIEITGEDE